MPKVSVKSSQDVRAADLPGGYSGSARTTVYFDGPAQPLHLHLFEIAAGEMLRMERSTRDRVAYVWTGGVEAGGYVLEPGSSLIVEHGGTLEIRGSGERSVLVAFSAAVPSRRPGGNVHLLPANDVPRMDALGGIRGLRGAMHADSACPTCELWLHENHIRDLDLPRDDEAGIHSHTEDEIIFVIDGEMRLGGKSCGPGTGLAIAADTLYGFEAGAQGLSFINFRAAKPGDIRFVRGPSVNEPDYWRQLPRPRYLAPRSDANA